MAVLLKGIVLAVRQLFRLRAAAVIVRDNKLLIAWNTKDNHYYSIGGAVRLG